jgi:uncharacterized YigZ family protein
LQKLIAKNNHLKYSKEEVFNTLEIKKSKFITYICPYDDFKKMKQRLQEEHPKARHFVYAYRYLNEFDQVVENSSDDGEPKGTSGRPSLKVLNGADIINTGVVIVRYFGGIRLGTGGLVKAYSDAVNLVCEKADFILYEKLQKNTIKIEYTNLSKTQYQLEKLNINIINQEFSEVIILTLESTQEKYEEYLELIQS